MAEHSLPMWIDSHAHLTMFEPDELDDVLARAAAAGVEGILVPATGADDLDTAVSLTARYPERVVVAVGVHPHEAASLDAGLKARVERALDEAGVVAVGEVGLDYHYMSSPREDQLRALEWHLDLAEARGLPVVLHNRDSWLDLEALLTRRSGRIRGVCHSFCERTPEANRVVELGLVLGFSGMLTFKTAGGIREAARAVPADTVLVETDSPYLAPVPHRGRRNEPALVTLVGQRLAVELGQGADQLARRAASTFRALFGLDVTWPGKTP